ncbi:MAG TPA: biotin transporter BioY [Aestuariivirgaceae bacterium]|jgi:biotin transport system substrate-specific component
MQSSLVANIWPQTQTSWLTKAVLVVLGTMLLAISAKLKVPFYPVPMTMQVFVVLVLGLAFGVRLAVATILLYLAEGAAYLPVFAGTPERGLGLPYMVGPTGGYLFGYLLAAAVVGLLADRGWSRHVGKAIIACLIGLALIYVPGILWLGSVIGWDKPVIDLGFTPFILGDLVKVLIAALGVTGVWHLSTNLTRA